MLTIITVTYNAEKFIKKLIDSINSQTDKSFQWLIVDGFSSDNTINIIKNNCNHKNIKILSERDNGIYNAMNKGANLASHEWLLYINADDYIEPNAVEIINEKLSYGYDLILFNVNEKFNLCNNIVDGVLKPQPSLIYFFNSIPHPGAVINKNTFLEYKYNEIYFIAADYDLFLNLILDRKKILICKDVISTHVRGGASSNISLSRKEIFIIRKNRLGLLFGISIELFLIMRRIFIKLKKYYF